MDELFRAALNIKKHFAFLALFAAKFLNGVHCTLYMIPSNSNRVYLVALAPPRLCVEMKFFI